MRIMRIVSLEDRRVLVVGMAFECIIMILKWFLLYYLFEVVTFSAILDQ